MPQTLSKKHIVVFGRPGSGKSSLADRLSERFGFRLVRTGELLRQAVRRRDAIGLRVEASLKAGALVPDALIFALLEQSLGGRDNVNLLFDGFPRTMGQVALLEKFESTLAFAIDAYLDIEVSRAEAVRRMSGRRVCPRCGATYHVVNQPPRVAETCDHDGARLESRPDDDPAVIDERQRVYEEHAGPILAYYRDRMPGKFYVINGEQPVDAVFSDTCRALGPAGLDG